MFARSAPSLMRRSSLLAIAHAPPAARQSSSSPHSSTIPPGLRPTVPVSDLCIPLTPPYSLLDTLSSTPPPVISDATLKHLHKLSGLPYPSGVGQEQINGLVGVIEGIRSDELKGMLGEETGVLGGGGRREVVIDGTGEEEGFTSKRE